MTSQPFRSLLSRAGFGIRRRMRFDFSHGLCVKEFLATSWAFVKLQIWHDVNLTFKIVSPIPFHFFNSFAATRRATCDINHKDILWPFCATGLLNEWFCKLLRH